MRRRREGEERGKKGEERAEERWGGEGEERSFNWDNKCDKCFIVPLL